VKVDFGEAVKPTGIGLWYRQVLPPLMILALTCVPLDIGTALFWLVAMLAAFVSALSPLARLSYNVFDRRGWIYLLPPPRSVLTIVFLALAFGAVHFSYLDAARFARNAATDIQRQCDRQRRCPDSVPGWQTGPGPEKTTFAGSWARYWVEYRVADDHRTFVVHLHRNIDDGTRYSGGVGKQVTIESDLD
jgi:hypothetical protein